MNEGLKQDLPGSPCFVMNGDSMIPFETNVERMHRLYKIDYVRGNSIQHGRYVIIKRNIGLNSLHRVNVKTQTIHVTGEEVVGEYKDLGAMWHAYAQLCKQQNQNCNLG